MPSPVRSVAPLVVAAVASGVASFATEGLPKLSHDMETQLTAYLINPKLLLPGVWFGLVTGALAWRLGSRGLLGAIISLIVTWIGWQLAVQAGIVTFDRLSSITPVESTKLAFAGMAGGAVGALMTFLGVRITTPFPRTLHALIFTLLLGAASGVVLAWSTTQQSAGLLLYATWQPMIVAVIAIFATARPSKPGA